MVSVSFMGHERGSRVAKYHHLWLAARGRDGEAGMVPIAARAAVRSPDERVGTDGNGPNAVCDAIRTRNASTFVPAPAPEPRDGSPKTWEQPLTLMNPENLAQRRSAPLDRGAGDLPSIASRGVLKPRPTFL